MLSGKYGYIINKIFKMFKCFLLILYIFWKLKVNLMKYYSMFVLSFIYIYILSLWLLIVINIIILLYFYIISNNF